MAYSEDFLQQMADSQDIFAWETSSWEKFERSKKWYIWMGIVAVVGMIYTIVTVNYLFTFIIFLTVIILTLAGNQEPRTILFQIGHNGVVYDGKLYTYNQLADFAIVYQPPETKILYIQPRNFLYPRMRVQLEDQDPVAIRNHLKQYMDEDLDLRNEHYSDIFARLLRL